MIWLHLLLVVLHATAEPKAKRRDKPDAGAETDSVGWSVGHCLRCQDLMPVSVDMLNEQNPDCLCDFCGSGVEEHLGENIIGTGEWCPSDGLSSLVARLDVPIAIDPEWQNSESRLNGLLEAAADASTLGKVRPYGSAVLGFFVGLFLALPLAVALHAWGLLPMALFPTTVTSFMLLWPMAGVLAGIYLGYRRESERRARKRIEITWRKYQIDLDRLQQVASLSPSRVVRAIRYLSARR